MLNLIVYYLITNIGGYIYKLISFFLCHSFHQVISAQHFSLSFPVIFQKILLQEILVGKLYI